MARYDTVVHTHYAVRQTDAGKPCVLYLQYRGTRYQVPLLYANYSTKEDDGARMKATVVVPKRRPITFLILLPRQGGGGP